MIAKTGSINISKIITDTGEIPTANPDYRPWRGRQKCRQVIAARTDKQEVAM